ncbi:uncharacterized protein PgNI_02773 [Pyricularia grisea]|uniref:Uncharacterized protein n=1 Tax=Pyricularia grisea TaxID=148305 RepID=A0A6P8BD96_PYRGI|nr:uncharacterized protein PgNI_02773 [Pyricularia grisea]TLD13734.1 hypothetical protein PgNI_02773 [Pyricularia grisea]
MYRAWGTSSNTDYQDEAHLWEAPYQVGFNCRRTVSAVFAVWKHGSKGSNENKDWLRDERRAERALK